jgi:hypothetical protein
MNIMLADLRDPPKAKSMQSDQSSKPDNAGKNFAIGFLALMGLIFIGGPMMSNSITTQTAPPPTATPPATIVTPAKVAPDLVFPDHTGSIPIESSFYKVTWEDLKTQKDVDDLVDRAEFAVVVAGIRGLRCDSITGLIPYSTGFLGPISGWKLQCNHFKYTYHVVDQGDQRRGFHGWYAKIID